MGEEEIETNCFAESVVCRVDFISKVSGLDQFTRFRVSQEELSRVQDKDNESPSSSDDSSSDGVDSDMQTETVHVVVTELMRTVRWCAHVGAAFRCIRGSVELDCEEMSLRFATPQRRLMHTPKC